MPVNKKSHIPFGATALILSKYYYGVLSRRLEGIEIDRYFSILYFLWANNGCTQQFICNHLAIDKSAMVKVMEYLLDSGYVQRKINPEDRREQFISLTAKGKKRSAEIVSCFDELDKQIFSGISKGDREVFTAVLRKVSDKVESLPGNDLFFNYKKTKKK